MSKYVYGGGQEVKARTLVVGDYIRSNKKRDRILIIEEIGNQIFARGLDKLDKNYFEFIQGDVTVIKVTNVLTDSSEI